MNLSMVQFWIHEHLESTWKDYKKVTFGEQTYTYEGYEVTLFNNDTIYSHSTGRYTYKHPNVYLTEEGETNTAIISGNSMTTQSENGIVFIKK